MSKACVIPWVHLNINPNGDVFPCCMSTGYNQPIGNVNKQSLESIWNSPALREMRLQFLNEEVPSICQKCFDMEQAGVDSTRVYKNKGFAKDLKTIGDVTSSDGSVEKINLKYWDFRFSNVCNYKCRSCGPQYSTSWEGAVKFEVSQVDLLPMREFVDRNIHLVEEIYFAGGEPLVMDIHWYIIEKLHQLGRFDVRIGYNTNLSKLTYKNKSIVDYWKDFKYVSVWPSIDDIGSRAELIRSGTKWKDVHQNLKTLVELNHIQVKPSITVSCLNVSSVVDTCKYFESIGIKGVGINIVFHESLSIDALPLDIRQEISQQLEEYISQSVYDRYSFQQLFAELEKPTNFATAKNFVKYMAQIDRERDENIYITLPELQAIKDIFI